MKQIEPAPPPPPFHFCLVNVDRKKAVEEVYVCVVVVGRGWGGGGGGCTGRDQACASPVSEGVTFPTKAAVNTSGFCCRVSVTPREGSSTRLGFERVCVCVCVCVWIYMYLACLSGELDDLFASVVLNSGYSRHRFRDFVPHNGWNSKLQRTKVVLHWLVSAARWWRRWVCGSECAWVKDHLGTYPPPPPPHKPYEVSVDPKTRERRERKGPFANPFLNAFCLAASANTYRHEKAALAFFSPSTNPFLSLSFFLFFLYTEKENTVFGQEGLWSWGEDAEGDDTSRTEKGGEGGTPGFPRVAPSRRVFFMAVPLPHSQATQWPPGGGAITRWKEAREGEVMLSSERGAEGGAGGGGGCTKAARTGYCSATTHLAGAGCSQHRPVLSVRPHGHNHVTVSKAHGVKRLSPSLSLTHTHTCTH